MKDSRECAKPPKPPRPNFKNKEFAKWTRSETCRREDSIVSTEWHETLKKTVPFAPAYDNKPLNMVYLLSGEYGRIWQKERDEWYSKVFVPKAREKDMQERKAKIRRQIREAKKAAEKSIRERKEQKAREAEAKAKAEAEKAEKMKAKLQACVAAKKAAKPPKKKESKDSEKPTEAPPTENTEKQDTCPKGWTPVELTLQCECSGHSKEITSTEKEVQEAQSPPKQTETNEEGCTMCPNMIQQLQNFQAKKSSEEENVRSEEVAVARE